MLSYFTPTKTGTSYSISVEIGVLYMLVNVATCEDFRWKFRWKQSLYFLWIHHWTSEYTMKATLHSTHHNSISHTFGMDSECGIFLFSLYFCVKNSQHKVLTVFYLHLTWKLATETYVDLDVKLDPDCVSSWKRLNSYKTFFSIFLSETQTWVCGGIIGCADSLQMLFSFN